MMRLVRFSQNRNMSQPLVQFHQRKDVTAVLQYVSFPLSNIEIRKSSTLYDESWSNCLDPLFTRRSAQVRASKDGLCILSTLNAYFMEKLFDEN